MAAVYDIEDDIKRLYGEPPATLRQADILLEWMKFDKKNRNNRINFSLIDAIGSCKVDIEASVEEIRAALR